jgi:hypothetical protein
LRLGNSRNSYPKKFARASDHSANRTDDFGGRHFAASTANTEWPLGPNSEGLMLSVLESGVAPVSFRSDGETSRAE